MDERWVPITLRYDRIMALFDNKDVPAERLDRYREELFGSSMEMVAPDHYNMLTLGKELVGSYMDFYNMLKDPSQVRVIAKMIAQIRLSQMVELVQRHDRLQQQKRKKLQDKLNAKSKKK